MLDVILEHRGNILVRRLVLEPGEALPWHVDPHHRVSVVLKGDLLRIEYRDGSDPQTIEVQPGLTGWDEPTDRHHRGVNAGTSTYEEITVFLLDSPDSTPQPRV